AGRGGRGGQGQVGLRRRTRPADRPGAGDEREEARGGVAGVPGTRAGLVVGDRRVAAVVDLGRHAVVVVRGGDGAGAPGGGVGEVRVRVGPCRPHEVRVDVRVTLVLGRGPGLPRVVDRHGDGGVAVVGDLLAQEALVGVGVGLVRDVQAGQVEAGDGRAAGAA